MINPFSGNGFETADLTLRINQAEYAPGLLGSLGIFQEDGIATTTAIVESDSGVLSIVPVAPRNGVPKAYQSSPGLMVPFIVPHIPTDSSVWPDEVIGVRQFGSDDEAATIDAVVNKKLAAMRRNLEYTIEAHRLVAVKGNYVSANSTEISLATTFGVSAPSPIAMDLDVDATEVSSKALQIQETIEDGLGNLTSSGVIALCGKTFFASLISHPTVKETVLNTPMAASLRSDPRNSIEFGGITWIRYRGTAAVKIADTEAYAFPTGVEGLFITRFAPANYIEFVGTIGIPVYAKSDLMRMGKGVDLEAQSNPLSILTRPTAVVKLTLT